MLGKNWIIITTYSPLQNNSVVPKKQASKVWRYLGDNLDGAIAKCLLCTYNPTKGDTHKLSLVTKNSSSHVQPWSSRFAKAPPSLEKPPLLTLRRSPRFPTEWRTMSFQLLPVDQLKWWKHHDSRVSVPPSCQVRLSGLPNASCFI